MEGIVYLYNEIKRVQNNSFPMKILVCISHVPDTTSKINFTDNNTKFDQNGVQYVINPNDEFGLTRALWFKEQQGASVHVITVGDAQCEPTLRKALAIGADEAIRVAVPATDGLVVAKALAQIVSEDDYDLIIAGREFLDYNGGMVPGMLAQLTGFAFVNTCIKLDIDLGKALAVREIDGGKETIEVALPLVIGGQKGLVEESDLRIPNMRGIMQARSKPLHVKELTPVATTATTLSYEKPAPKEAVTLVSGVDELIDLLHKEAKVL